MRDRHLRPDEFELLLDGEEGFGVAPLRAHVKVCASCQLEYEQARSLMVTLDMLPDFAPSHGFGDRVMSQVQVFEPWHAAALTTAKQFVPATRPARVAAGLGAALSAGVLTASITWAVARADIALPGADEVEALIRRAGLSGAFHRAPDRFGAAEIADDIDAGDAARLRPDLRIRRSVFNRGSHGHRKTL